MFGAVALAAIALAIGCGRQDEGTRAPESACPRSRDGVAVFLPSSPASLFVVLENRGAETIEVPFSVGTRWPKLLSVSAGTPVARPAQRVSGQSAPGTPAGVAFPPTLELEPAQSALVHVQCPACTAEQMSWTLELPITTDDAKLLCTYRVASTVPARIERPTHVPRFTSEPQFAASAQPGSAAGVFQHGIANEGLLAFFAALSSEDQRAIVKAQLAETAPGAFRRFLTLVAAHAGDASAQREIDAALRSSDQAIREEARHGLAFATFRLGASDWLCGSSVLEPLTEAEREEMKAVSARRERACK